MNYIHLHNLITRKEPKALLLWKLMLENMKNKNPLDIGGFSILHAIALCFPNETEKFRMVMELMEDNVINK